MPKGRGSTSAVCEYSRIWANERHNPPSGRTTRVPTLLLTGTQNGRFAGVAAAHRSLVREPGYTRLEKPIHTTHALLSTCVCILRIMFWSGHLPFTLSTTVNRAILLICSPSKKGGKKKKQKYKNLRARLMCCHATRQVSHLICTCLPSQCYLLSPPPWLLTISNSLVLTRDINQLRKLKTLFSFFISRNRKRDSLHGGLAFGG